MNIGDLFQRLSFGELSNLSLAEGGSGFIALDQQDKLVSHANAALTQIYSRFAHKTYYVTFALDAGRETYKVAADDTALQDPGSFPGSVIKIIGAKILDDPATTDDESETLGINHRRGNRSIKIGAHDAIRVEDPKDGEILEVEYRGRHRKLTVPADLAEEINIHPALEEALEANVAARVYSSMNGEGNMIKSKDLFNAYEVACAIVSAEDLLNETGIDEFDRLRAAGWV